MFSKFRKSKPQATFDAPLMPDEPFCAMGDLHGCDTLFCELVTQLEQTVEHTSRLVLVGDYIDRGEQSRALIERLCIIQTELGSDALTCLRGNHEQMLIDALDDPVASGPRWIRHGGLQTLASYGLPSVKGACDDSDWIALRDRLREAIGPDVERWLRDLPLSWQTGNVFVCHAGAAPHRPLTEQRDSTLLWGHSDFNGCPRNDGNWVLHGHTICDEPFACDGRISIDTGAYATGRLTAAIVEQGNLRFVSTGMA